METCMICLWTDKDDVIYGDWMTTKSSVNAHYFCLLSATNLPQRGTCDTSGIARFLIADIIEFASAIRETECYLCGQKSAAVHCAEDGCDRKWHYTCGTRNSCMTVFDNKFDSYCSKHVPDQNEGKKHGSEICRVCLGALSSYHPADSIISSCCLKLPDWDQCFLHKKCVMQYTQNAGYDSICINCSMEDGITKEMWQQEMRSKGIFIPIRQASWERDGRYKDHVKNKCGEPSCSQPNKTANVYTCFVCGCFPKHLKCAQVTTFEEYYCPKCFDQSFVNRVPKIL